jgi:hypothetical protein
MTAYKNVKKYWAQAAITILDTLGNPVENASVSITWSGVVSGSETKATGSSGVVIFTSAESRYRGPFTITVKNVTHAALPYDPALNKETTDSITY